MVSYLQYIVGGKDSRDECWLDVWAYRSAHFQFPRPQTSPDKGAGHQPVPGDQLRKRREQTKPPESETARVLKCKCHWEDEIRVLALSPSIPYVLIVQIVLAW